MDYKTALSVAIHNTELVENYDRLTGSSLSECLKSVKAGGLNLQIDLATGRMKEEIQNFDQFFNDFVWQPLQYIVKHEAIK